MSRKKQIFVDKHILQEGKFPPVLYGLEGIMQMFKVSKATASRYKNTILKDAIAQNGRVIVINTKEALRIYGMCNSDGMVEKVK